MKTIWRCIQATLPPALAVTCQEAGSYDHKAVSGDSGPANEHTRATGHVTVTHIAEWAECSQVRIARRAKAKKRVA